MDLEIILGWHAFAYLCTLLGCSKDVPQTSVDDGDSHDVNMELKGNGVRNICDDAPIITYLQASEILIGLTPKEWDLLCIRLSGSNGKVIPSYGCS
jgi:hypothetical protein